MTVHAVEKRASELQAIVHGTWRRKAVAILDRFNFPSRHHASTRAFLNPSSVRADGILSHRAD